MSRYNGDEGKVYVGDLPRDASEREIERVFREYGSLRSVWVARNPPGFAFVMFEDERDAEDAVKALDGSTICGVRARVKHSSDRPSRPRPPMRRHFDPNDRCYRCNQRGHYAYDCDKYSGGSKSRRSYSRSRSRSYEKRKSYSRSPSHSRNRGRSHTRSRSRSK